MLPKAPLFLPFASRHWSQTGTLDVNYALMVWSRPSSLMSFCSTAVVLNFALLLALRLPLNLGPHVFQLSLKRQDGFKDEILEMSHAAGEKWSSSGISSESNRNDAARSPTP
jgi:hypothetical protein